MKNLKFKISELRKDKIVYGVEAIVVNTVCLIMIILSYNFGLPVFISSLVALGALGYSAYCLIGNYYRLLEIKKLEKKL